jgi:hypothetical protein
MRHTCERIARIIADANQLFDNPDDAMNLAIDLHFYLLSTLVGTLLAHSPPEERDPREFESAILELQARYLAGDRHKQMMAAFLSGVRVRDIIRKATGK